MKRTKNKCCAAAFFLALMSSSAVGQQPIAQSPIGIADLPSGIEYEGLVKGAIRWTDSLGDHITLITETGEYPSKVEKDTQDAELFAYNYRLNNGVPILTWRVYDFVKGCPLDMEAKFVKNTLRITDLDHDGQGEVWLMYRTVCHGDVSPSTMKIIMYRGQQKYAMRGQTKVKVSEKEYYGGDYKFDKELTKAPKAFRDFAQTLWQKNVIQDWDD